MFSCSTTMVSRIVKYIIIPYLFAMVDVPYHTGHSECIPSPAARLRKMDVVCSITWYKHNRRYRCKLFFSNQTCSTKVNFGIAHRFSYTCCISDLQKQGNTPHYERRPIMSEHKKNAHIEIRTRDPCMVIK